MDCPGRISLSVLMADNYYFISSLSPNRAAEENVKNDSSAGKRTSKRLVFYFIFLVIVEI